MGRPHIAPIKLNRIGGVFCEMKKTGIYGGNSLGSENFPIFLKREPSFVHRIRTTNSTFIKGRGQNRPLATLVEGEYSDHCTKLIPLIMIDQSVLRALSQSKLKQTRKSIVHTRFEVHQFLTIALVFIERFGILFLFYNRNLLIPFLYRLLI